MKKYLKSQFFFSLDFCSLSSICNNISSKCVCVCVREREREREGGRERGGERGGDIYR